MSEITEATLLRIYRDYCLAKFPYPANAYASAEDREAHIAYDARSYLNSAHNGQMAVLVQAAFAAGRESAFEGGEVSYDWATRWTESDGYAHITSANSARAGAECLARKRAKQEMRGVGPGEAVRRVQFVGPWVAMPEEVA